MEGQAASIYRLSSTQKTEHEGAERLSLVTTTTEIRSERPFLSQAELPALCFAFVGTDLYMNSEWPERPNPPASAWDYWYVPAVLASWFCFCLLQKKVLEVGKRKP